MRRGAPARLYVEQTFHVMALCGSAVFLIFSNEQRPAAASNAPSRDWPRLAAAKYRKWAICRTSFLWILLRSLRADLPSLHLLLLLRGRRARSHARLNGFARVFIIGRFSFQYSSSSLLLSHANVRPGRHSEP